MTKEIEFLITCPRDGQIEIRWLEELGRVKAGAYRALQDELEELRGVEDIWVGRYSAILTVARHVVSERELAAEVYEVLNESQELRSAVRFQFHDATVTVVNVLEPRPEQAA